MKFAVCSDAHGNRVFYDMCISWIESYCVDGIIYLGDIFGYMDEGLYIKNDLIKKKAVVLKGNHEAMLLGELELDEDKDKIYGLNIQKRKLNKEDYEWIKNLPEHYKMETSEGEVIFVHGSLRNYVNGYLYEDDDTYDWNEPDYRMIFMGHTHRAFVRNEQNTSFINVGSMGLPRDIGNRPSFCIFDTDNMQIEVINLLIEETVFRNAFFCGVNKEVLEVLNRR